jgi:hypothetical protein
MGGAVVFSRLIGGRPDAPLVDKTIFLVDNTEENRYTKLLEEVSVTALVEALFIQSNL